MAARSPARGRGPGRKARAPTKPRPSPAAAEIPGSIYGVGVDLLRLERMEKAYARHGQRLVQKILCPAEQAQLKKRAARPARYLAMCFAGKEALVKALGTGFHGVGYRDGGVVHEASGKPVLVFSARLQARLQREGIGGGHVSLTDEGGLICAFVVLEKIR